MKIQALAATLLATTLLAGGSVSAQDAPQATMQPIPNPPAKPMMAKKHMMKKHMKAPMAATDSMSKGSTDTMSTPAPAPK